MKKFVVLSFMLGLGFFNLYAAERNAADTENNAQNLRFSQENKDVRKDMNAESADANKGAAAENAASSR